VEIFFKIANVSFARTCLFCNPGVYGLASDNSTSISVVGNWSDVLPSMLQFLAASTSVYVPVLCRLSAPVEAFSRVPYRDPSCYENAEVCTGHWWPCWWLSLPSLRVDTGTLVLMLYSVLCFRYYLFFMMFTVYNIYVSVIHRTMLMLMLLLGMWRIPNPHPNPTESGTFFEVRNPTDT